MFNDDYYCPNCDADLNKQLGFSPYGDTWTCTECGQLLYDDDSEDNDDFPGVAWRCDDCNALLNKQSGFSDSRSTWVCTECGHENSISEDEIYESERHYKQAKAAEEMGNRFGDWVCGKIFSSQTNDDDDDDDDWQNQQSNDNTSTYQRHRAPVRRESDWKAQAISFIFIAIVGAVVFFYMQYEKATPIGYDMEDFIGQQYTSVEANLRGEGFIDIEFIVVDDLTMEEIQQENIVTQVKLQGRSDFDAEDTYPFDGRIVITYHTLKEISIPISAKNAVGTQYSDVLSKLEIAGFVNITLKQTDDLIVGWFKTEYDVKEITVDGNSKFEESDLFRPDAEIILTYYTFEDKS